MQILYQTNPDAVNMRVELEGRQTKGDLVVECRVTIEGK